MNKKTIPVVLTIAGSDSSGGAGIQADLKTFAALNVYGCSAITSVTAQNHLTIRQSQCLPASMVIAQCTSIFDAFHVAAIKIGVLGNDRIIKALAHFFKAQPNKPILVLDPIIKSSSGIGLLEDHAIEQMKAHLIPQMTLLTPNLYEAAYLVGAPIPKNDAAMQQMIPPLLTLGCPHVLLKGGHLPGPNSTDFLSTKKETITLTTPRVHARGIRGTGCTLSAAIVAYYAQGYTLKEAVMKAKSYLYESIITPMNIAQKDQTSRLIHHFSKWWP